MSVCIYVCMCVCLYVCVYVCMHVCIQFQTIKVIFIKKKSDYFIVHKIICTWSILLLLYEALYVFWVELKLSSSLVKFTCRYLVVSFSLGLKSFLL